MVLDDIDTKTVNQVEETTKSFEDLVKSFPLPSLAILQEAAEIQKKYSRLLAFDAALVNDTLKTLQAGLEKAGIFNLFDKMRAVKFSSLGIIDPAVFERLYPRAEILRVAEDAFQIRSSLEEQLERITETLPREIFRMPQFQVDYKILDKSDQTQFVRVFSPISKPYPIEEGIEVLQVAIRSEMQAMQAGITKSIKCVVEKSLVEMVGSREENLYCPYEPCGKLAYKNVNVPLLALATPKGVLCPHCRNLILHNKVKPKS